MNSITIQPFARKLDIPHWIRELSQEYIEANTNECGSGWNQGIVPDSFFSLVNESLPVGGVCNIHDLEYGHIKDLYDRGLITFKQAEAMRKIADNRMRDNLNMVVECQYQIDVRRKSYCLWFWTSEKWRDNRARYKRLKWVKIYYTIAPFPNLRTDL